MFFLYEPSFAPPLRKLTFNLSEKIWIKYIFFKIIKIIHYFLTVNTYENNMQVVLTKNLTPPPTIKIKYKLFYNNSTDSNKTDYFFQCRNANKINITYVLLVSK